MSCVTDIKQLNLILPSYAKRQKNERTERMGTARVRVQSRLRRHEQWQEQEGGRSHDVRPTKALSIVALTPEIVRISWQLLQPGVAYRIPSQHIPGQGAALW